jgi:hypothetical protein
VLAVAASLDAVCAIRALLETEKLPMTALYPLLRSAIENAALAIYLLEPESRDDRLRRSYRVAEDDAKGSSNFRDLMADDDGSERHVEPESSATNSRDITRGEILRLIESRSSLGDPDAYRSEPLRYPDVVKVADSAMGEDKALDTSGGVSLFSWWQLLSGLRHGKQRAMLPILNRSDAIVDVADKSAEVKLTSSAVVITLVFQRATETLETALRLCGCRPKDTWNLPEDASEPDPERFSPMHPNERPESSDTA